MSFDSAVYDQTHNIELRQREFAWLDISGDTPQRKTSSPKVLARGAKLEKLAGGFYNISGGTTGPKGEFYFIDSHWQRIYRWETSSRQLSTISDLPLDPVNLASDKTGNLMVVSYAGKGTVYSIQAGVGIVPLTSETIGSSTNKDFYLPVSDWRVNQQSLTNPVAQFASPDGSTLLPVAKDFLNGVVSWGVKSSPQIRSFGLAKAVPGQPFYVTDEADCVTWVAEVNVNGGLQNFRLFAEQGGEGLCVDLRGNVYIAAGQVYVYSPEGKLIDTIEVPERPTQVVFGGVDGRTLFIPARTSLYCVKTRYKGR